MAKQINKEVLGKGLKALLGNIEQKSQIQKAELKSHESLTTKEKEVSVSMVAIDLIEPNPNQPRKEFEEEALEQLSQSLALHGIIQPITVRKLNETSYQIISGERRWRAAKLAKLTEVPVYIREIQNVQLLELALIENIQREDLNPMEIAISYHQLIQECNITHEELADRVHKNRSTVTNFLRILKLPPAVQKALKLEAISMGHAKVISGLTNIDHQLDLLEQILSKGLNVRATESLAKEYDTVKTKKTVDIQTNHDPDTLKIQDQLTEYFGGRVFIQKNAKGKGNIKIPFDSVNDLNAILQQILT